MATRARVALTPRWLLQAKDASQVAPELSAMVVYCQAVPFPGLARALRHPRPYEMSSFSERKARKLIKEAGEGNRVGMGQRGSMLLTSLGCGMGLRLVGSVTGVAPWVVVTGVLASAGLLWSRGRGQGEGHRSRVRVCHKGLESGLGMGHLGPRSGLGCGAGIKVRVKVYGPGGQGLGSKVKVWGQGQGPGPGVCAPGLVLGSGSAFGV